MGDPLEPAPAAAAPSRLLGVPEELIALACYVPLCGAGALLSAVVLVLVRRRPGLRFHAWQAVLLAAAAAVLVGSLWLGDFALEAAGLPTPGLATVGVQLALAAAYVAISARAMVRAYQGRDTTFPLLGRLARRWSGAM